MGAKLLHLRTALLLFDRCLTQLFIYLKKGPLSRSVFVPKIKIKRVLAFLLHGRFLPTAPFPVLALGHMRCHLMGVPPQSNSPPGAVPRGNCTQAAQGFFFFLKRPFVLQLRILHGTMKIELPTSCNSDQVQPKTPKPIKKNSPQTYLLLQSACEPWEGRRHIDLLTVLQPWGLALCLAQGSRHSFGMNDLETRMHAELLQSCLTLCDPMNCNPPGTSVYGIFQSRILEWVAMPSSRGFS